MTMAEDRSNVQQWMVCLV